MPRRPPRVPSRIPSMVLAALVLAGCQPRTVVVEDARVRLPAVAGNPAAAYFTVSGGDAPDRLVAVAGPAGSRTELHASMMRGGTRGGTMTMTPLAGIDVPAHGIVAFAPGGTHAMLFDLPPVRPGASVPLTLRFRSGAVVTTDAKTLAAGDPD